MSFSDLFAAYAARFRALISSFFKNSQRGSKSTNELVEAAQATGYKSITFRDIGDIGLNNWEWTTDERGWNVAHTPGNTDVIVAFDANQLKSADPVTYDDDDGNVIPLSERFNSEQEDIRYSREISQDEVKNAPVSFGITKLNDYIHVQNQVFLTLMREGFFNENNRRIVTNRDSKKDIEIGKRGIEETFGKGNRFQNLPRILKELKLAAVRLIPDMIENGEIVDADVSNKHNGKSGITYSYIKSNLTVDGTTYPVYIDIRQSPQKNMFWVHSIRTEKSQRLGAGSDNTDNDAVNEPLTSKLDDTTSGEKVNTQNEKHSREVDPTVLAELDRAEKNGSSRNSIELDPGVIDAYYNSLPISKKEQPERKISKTRTNTYELSGFFDKVINDLKDADEGMYAYDVVHEKQTTDAARERLLADFEGKADFLNGKARGRTADLPIFIGRFFYL